MLQLLILSLLFITSFSRCGPITCGKIMSLRSSRNPCSHLTDFSGSYGNSYWGWTKKDADEFCQDIGKECASGYSRNRETREIRVCCKGEIKYTQIDPEGKYEGCNKADVAELVRTNFVYDMQIKERNVPGLTPTGSEEGLIFNWIEDEIRKLILADQYGNVKETGKLPKCEDDYRDVSKWNTGDSYHLVNFDGCVARKCTKAKQNNDCEWTTATMGVCPQNPQCPPGKHKHHNWQLKYASMPPRAQYSGKYGMNCISGYKINCCSSSCSTWGPTTEEKLASANADLLKTNKLLSEALESLSN